MKVVGACELAIAAGARLRCTRLACRGLVRQLGKPALLAATYKGDVAAIATAAMEELESTLVDSISQLERFSPGSGRGPALI